jgi:NADPH:quinone reductase-like Zn-dependent oxidoreductase
MKAIVYTETGGPEVLQLVERPDPEPTEDEVVVRVAVSGVNPTDWKARSGDGPGRRLAFPEIVPNMDGAGTIVAVGADVDPSRVGERVCCGKRRVTGRTAARRSWWPCRPSKRFPCPRERRSTSARASASQP